MPGDPFSDILQLANAQSVVSGGFTAGGPWSIAFQPPDKIKFFALVRGSCWLRVAGESEPRQLAAGDVFLIAQRGFTLASDLSCPSIAATDRSFRAVASSRNWAKVMSSFYSAAT